MGTNYTLGYNGKFLMAPLSAGVPGTYVQVGQTKDLSGPEPEIGKVNVTNNDSPNNTKETAPGMINPGDQEIELIYRAGQANVLYATFGDGNFYGFKEIYADGSYWTFIGFLSKFGIETKTEDEANTNKFTVTLTTKPAFTVGAGDAPS
jgi:hypothetical protein